MQEVRFDRKGVEGLVRKSSCDFGRSKSSNFSFNSIRSFSSIYIKVGMDNGSSAGGVLNILDTNGYLSSNDL